MEVSGRLHTPAALPPRKQPTYQLHRRLGGFQGRAGANKIKLVKISRSLYQTCSCCALGSNRQSQSVMSQDISSQYSDWPQAGKSGFSW